VSNFARKGFECKHNQAYWHLQSYAGAGSGAVGSIFCADDTHSSLRYSIPKDVAAYVKSNGVLEAEIELIDKKTEMFEYLMMGFRTLEGVSSNIFIKRFGEKLEDKIGAENGVFFEWRQQGLAVTHDDRYALTKEGLLYLNRFLESL
jgi:oxygen-independent coproporphyrinogen-3 oxidase